MFCFDLGIRPPLPIKFKMSSITVVVTALSYAGLAISPTLKSHIECDAKQCKIYKRTCTLYTLSEYKVRLIKLV